MESFGDFATRRAKEKMPAGFKIIKSFPNRNGGRRWLEELPASVLGEISDYKLFPFDGPAGLVLEIVAGSESFSERITAYSVLQSELYRNE